MRGETHFNFLSFPSVFQGGGVPFKELKFSIRVSQTQNHNLLTESYMAPPEPFPVNGKTPKFSYLGEEPVGFLSLIFYANQ